MAATSAADAAPKDPGNGQAEAAATPAQQQQVLQRKQWQLRDYFRVRPLPWWLCFFIFTYVLWKLLMTMNSPCSVLGTRSPVSSSSVSKAYRNLSKCRHPDLLRRRLGREPSATELHRQEIMFNQATAARDELVKMIGGRKGESVPCYTAEFEVEVFLALARLSTILATLGIQDYLQLFMEIFWNIVSFEGGFINTILSLLWMGFILRIVKQFIMYLWRMGIIRGTLAMVTTTIIGPLPTVFYFCFLPFIRMYACVVMLVKAAKGETPETAAPLAAEAAASQPPAPPSTTMPAAREDMPRNLKQRKKKETEEEREKRNKEVLTGDNNARLTWTSPNCDDGLLKCVQWSHKEPIKARQVAAEAVQFDLLLILTKPIIPLFMLIAVGQVLNGLLSSLFIGHALRKWVPKMSHEAHHILCVVFGALHTLLGVSASEVEDFANREGHSFLHLQWRWSGKDVMAVMHMSLLGATVTQVAGLGNEPSFASSFAAGIALRIFLAQDSIRTAAPVQLVTTFLEAKLKDLGVVLDGAEESVTVAFDDCGGGPFRMLFGDGPHAWVAATVLKVWLMVIPVMATMHWLQRTILAQRALGKRFKMMRFVQRTILCSVAVMQCYLMSRMELNAYNGPLANFWVAMLFGCAIESLLSTYDVRGPVRQLVFLALFVLA
mmetsp:Transcript_48015/g.114119  ORF Transcript_48015/g.114119 Transcript_48015/m.114119 type:complete len:663 (+) Transcript_48015:67-2055(+)